MQEAKAIPPSPLQVVHSRLLDEGYDTDLSPEENRLLDNMANAISKYLLSLDK